MKKNVQLELFDLLPESELKARIKESRARREANAKAREAEVGADTTPLPGIGHYMALNQVPASTNAIELTEALAVEVQHHHRRTRKPTAESVRAAGAIVADLLQAIPLNVGYAYRSVGSDSFLGSPVGRHPFKATMEAMIAIGYVERRKGFMYLGGGADERCASRFIPTPKFIATAAGHGLDAAGWSENFQAAPRPVSIPNPIVLKTASTKEFGRYGPKVAGVSMPIDRTNPVYLEKKAEVDFLNRFMSKQTLENCSHYAFQRIYNNGNGSGSDFKQGGRTYSVGGGFQQYSAEKRLEITINREQVVEVDFSCCQPSILSALLNMPLKLNIDAYSQSEYPRMIIKLYCAQTMGSRKLPGKWSLDNRVEYGEFYLWDVLGQQGPPNIKQLSKDYPIRKVRAAAIECIPALAKWNDYVDKWGTLQNIESDIMMDAMLRLAKDHGVPALPVHDSLIVPVSAAGISRKIMSTCFFDRLGVYPRLK